MPLLTKKDIQEIFSDIYLYEKESFQILDRTNLTYNETRKRQGFLKEAELIRNCFLNGHTIIVKNLESFNEKIRLKAASLGRDVDVHMYLVPHNGRDGLDYHIDDRDVLVHVVYGEKIFIFKDDSSLKEHRLKAEDELFIPQGVVHKAVPISGVCHLSFGINTRIYNQIAGGIEEADL